ncbi:MAG: hypothetical protein PHV75_06535 [Victivallaceae bacterium]|jgi:hypothetical protein|nr:hypothetical protein [Victivallaceae bacterium]NLK83244.1 hypothetical protein [Lentisphaerota bacterium]MDD3116293.1 hypothetical protein [Victivallaceae bacterium]MDD3704005.1 hypothetical protein [Victivallaceae bacterium]MDD4318157.1 hypothetical protein [Victivallaceae bacterium]
MLAKFMFTVSGAVLLLLGVGCTRIVSVAEALQQPKGGRIFTAHNIWYQDPENISAVNYQKGGRFISQGTEVEMIEATEKKIVFKDMAGIKFTINYDKSMMMIPIQNYIRQTFTLKSKAEQLDGLSAQVIQNIERGIVIEGMTRDEVRLTCGPPPTFRTPDPNNATWIYFLDVNETYRVIFGDKRVKVIMNIND